MKPLLPILAASLVVASPVTSHAFFWDKKAATPPPLPASAPGSTAILLGTDNAAKTLGLTSLQRAILNDIRKEYRERARAIVRRVEKGQLSKAEGRKQIVALTETYNRRAEGTLNASQRAKFVALERRYLGAFALLEPAVQNELQLTPKQRERLARVWAEYEQHASDVHVGYELGEVSHNARVYELWELRYDFGAAMLKALTPEQRAKFTAITGQPS